MDFLKARPTQRPIHYLAAEYQAQQECNGQLRVAEEYYVEQVGIRWFLQKQPGNRYFQLTINNYQGEGGS